MIKREWPKPNELVVCTVSEVVDFGAYVKLDEYGKKEGLITIAEVAPGWIKNIRNYVREGQKIVCRVLKVDPSKYHIDLSLKDVNKHQRRQKIQEWKNELKAEKWLQLVAEGTGTSNKELQGIIDLLIDKFENLYIAFEEAAIKGPNILTDIGVNKKQANAITKIASENIKIPLVDITGYVDLTCPLPNGVDIIKNALDKATIIDEKNVKLEISYTGAPRYRIRVIAPDYKKAEKLLRLSAQIAIDTVKSSGGLGEFHRH